MSSPPAAAGSSQASASTQRVEKDQQKEGTEKGQQQQQGPSGEEQKQKQQAAARAAAAPLLAEGGRDGAAQGQQKGDASRGREGKEREGGKDDDEQAEAAGLEAAAAMARAAEEEEKREQAEAFELYNKGLTSLMTFDESGQPVLVPVSPSAEVAAALGILPTTTAAGSEDTEGQYEAVPPPQGPCAGLCPPYGALPEQMPLLAPAKEKQAVAAAAAKREALRRAAEEEGGEVVEEGGHLFVRKPLGRGLSLFTLPAKGALAAQFPLETDCPVPLWQHLPLSPFLNSRSIVGVDVYCIKEDLSLPEYRDAIPLYDFHAVAEAAAVAGRELQDEEQQLIKKKTGDAYFFQRLDTLSKSELAPGRIALD